MAKDIEYFRKSFFRALIFCVPLVYFSMGIHWGLPDLKFSIGAIAFIQFIFSTCIIITGYLFYKRGILAVIRVKTANMDTLIALSTASSYIYSVVVSIFIWTQTGNYHHAQLYYEVSGVLMVFILLGRYLEAGAREKTSFAITELFKLQPLTAVIFEDGEEKEISAEDVKTGQILVVKPGAKIPVDGIITEGYSTIDESMLTGESIPVEKTKGSAVIGGTINKNGSFRFRATKVGKDTVLSRIVELVVEAQQSKPKVQELADTISAYFVPGVLIIATISFIIWFFAAGQSFGISLKIFISVLIIACPCSLGLATPTAVIVALGLAAKNGILIKDAKIFQIAPEIKTVIFDKTGTITKGTPEVTDFEILNDGTTNHKEILKAAAAAEYGSGHPLSMAIVDYAKKKGIKTKNILNNFKVIEGKGISAAIGGKEIIIGKKEFLTEQDAIIDPQFDKRAIRFSAEGKTLVWIAARDSSTGGKFHAAGLFALRDELKHNSKKTVMILQEKYGLDVILMSGDGKTTSNVMGLQAGIKKNIGGMLPSEKADEVKKISRSGSPVIFVGDGINDAPALAAADIGIAIGSGTDIAAEAGNIILMNDNLEGVITAIDLSRYAMKKIRQNLFWAFFYNIISIPVAAGLLYPLTGFTLNPMIAGAAMSLSSITVVTNSLLMNRYGRKKINNA